ISKRTDPPPPTPPPSPPPPMSSLCACASGSLEFICRDGTGATQTDSDHTAEATSLKMCADQLAAPEASSPGCAHPTAAAVAVIAGKGKSGGYTRLNKPAASYTALIATAIQDSPQKKLTLLEIIGRLQQQYECFNGAYKGWKNSVRHTLSVNKCFVKVPRDASRPYAKDNFWTLAAVEDYVNADGTFRPRRR
uniref:Fork-head domain-containing protein n=1 Tax=Petromyzon marinus TaxID=7757 RepID=S4RRD6_PETMA